MTIRIEKPAFNLRSKLNDLDFGQVSYEKMPVGSVIQVQHNYVTDQTVYGTTNSPDEAGKI